MDALKPLEFDNRRILLTAQLAELYGTTDEHIKKNYNNNKGRYKENLDFTCIQGEALKVFKNQVQDLDLVDKHASSLYLWYEHGALLHAKSLGTDEAWATYGHLVDTYFIAQEMQQELKNAKTKSPAAPVADASEKRAKAMLINAKYRAAKMLKDLFAGAGVKPEYQIMALQDFYGEDGPKLPAIALSGMRITHDKSAIAKRLGIYSRTGNPHAQAVGAIISVLDIKETEREKVPYFKNGHDGFDWQYTEPVIEKIRIWLEKHGYPAPLIIRDKKYNVSYRNAQ